MIHENQIEFLDEVWRPPSRGAKARSGIPMMLAAAYLATRPSGGTGQRRAKLERLAKRAPEAMVKVTGRQRGGAHTLAHLDYIARHGKLEVETSDAEVLRGKARLEEIAAEWALKEDATTKRRDPLTSVSMILSMQAATPRSYGTRRGRLPVSRWSGFPMSWRSTPIPTIPTST